MVGAISRIEFEGHPLIRALHPNTIELTKAEEMTTRGDCIIGVSADKGVRDIDLAVKVALRTNGVAVKLTIRVGGERFVFGARGSPGLSLEDPNDLVIRRSGFVSPRTLAVKADAAAKDVPRTIVERLKNRERGTLAIEVLFP